MSGLGSLGALASAAAAASDLVKEIVALVRGRAAARDRQADRADGATIAEAETLENTAEIADAQARNAARHPDSRSIARELLEEAERTDGHAAGGRRPGDAGKSDSRPV